MIKYYTLVQNGRQEGVGAGNQKVSALLPAFKTVTKMDININSREIIIFSNSFPVTLREPKMFHSYCFFHCQINGDFFISAIASI